MIMNSTRVITNYIDKNRKKISIILTFMILFIFYFPAVLDNTAIFRYLRWIQTVVTCVSLVLFFVLLNKNNFLRLLTLFYFIFFISTLFNNGDYGSFVYYFTSVYGQFVFLYLLFNISKQSVIKSAMIYALIMLFIHVVFLLINNEGVVLIKTDSNITKWIHFLGESNQTTLTVISLYLIYLSGSIYLDKLNLFTIIISLLTILSLMLIKSSTGKIGLMVLIFGLASSYILKLKNKDLFKNNYLIKSTIFVLFLIIIYLLVVVFRVQEIIEPIIKKLFNKDATLSYRTLIWDYSIEKIKNSPILGYGAIKGRYIYVPKFNHQYDPHNIMLDMFLKGGLLMFTTFILMIFVSIKEIFKNKNLLIKYAFSAFIFTSFVMSLSEVYALNVVITMIFIPYVMSKNSIDYLNVAKKKLNLNHTNKKRIR